MSTASESEDVRFKQSLAGKISLAVAWMGVASLLVIAGYWLAQN